jgi:hypothetical protein
MPRSSDATRRKAKQQSRSDKPTTRSLPLRSQRENIRPKASTTRPETHQNLIHTNKDRDAMRSPGPARTEQHTSRRPRFEANTTLSNCFLLRDDTRHEPQCVKHQAFSHTIQSSTLNTRHTPRRSKAGNGGGGRDRTDDPLLAKQVLSQLSYTPIGRHSRQDGGPGQI